MEILKNTKCRIKKPENRTVEQQIAVFIRLSLYSSSKKTLDNLFSNIKENYEKQNVADFKICYTDVRSTPDRIISYLRKKKITIVQTYASTRICPWDHFWRFPTYDEDKVECIIAGEGTFDDHRFKRKTVPFKQDIDDIELKEELIQESDNKYSNCLVVSNYLDGTAHDCLKLLDPCIKKTYKKKNKKVFVAEFTDKSTALRFIQKHQNRTLHVTFNSNLDKKQKKKDKDVEVEVEDEEEHEDDDENKDEDKDKDKDVDVEDEEEHEDDDENKDEDKEKDKDVEVEVEDEEEHEDDDETKDEDTDEEEEMGKKVQKKKTFTREPYKFHKNGATLMLPLNKLPRVKTKERSTQNPYFYENAKIEVIVIWDMQNCKVNESFAEKYVEYIRNKYTLENEVSFICVTDVYTHTDKLIEIVCDSRVTVIHEPTDEKQTADKVIKHLVKLFSSNRRLKAKIVLITGDSDFITTVEDIMDFDRNQLCLIYSKIHNGDFADMLNNIDIRFETRKMHEEIIEELNVNATTSKIQMNATTSYKQVNATTSEKQVNATTSDKQVNATTSDKQVNATTSDKQVNATTSGKQVNATTSGKQVCAEYEHKLRELAGKYGELRDINVNKDYVLVCKDTIHAEKANDELRKNYGCKVLKIDYKNNLLIK